MRIILAIVIFAGGMLALDATAQEASKSKRSAKQSQSHKAKKVSRSKAETACEARARQEDPTGQYASYPCWAREAFARGARIDNQ